MRSIYNILPIFIINFIIQYSLVTFLLVRDPKHITHNLPKLYLALFIAFVAVIVDFGFHDYKYGVFSLRAYLILVSIITVIIYLYKTETFLFDKGYLKNMIESNSNALFMSERILEKTNNYHVAKIAKTNIQYINDEIRIMSELLKKMDNKEQTIL